MEGKRATRSNESCPVAQTLRLSENTESTTSFRHIYNAKKINDQNSINEELSIIYTNADSLTNKRGELKLLLDFVFLNLLTAFSNATTINLFVVYVLIF